MPKRLSQLQGFTLLEMLLALSLMTLLAVLGWRGVDALLATQQRTHAASMQSAAIATLATQWLQDLDQMRGSEPAQTWAFERSASGRALLRLTRTGADGAGWSVVAWTIVPASDDGSPTLYRWQSPSLTAVAQWQQAWAQAASISSMLGANNPHTQLQPTPMLAAQDFDVQHWHNQAWTPAASSTQASSARAPLNDKTAHTPPALSPLPDGLQLRLHLEGGESITLQWTNPTRQNK